MLSPLIFDLGTWSFGVDSLSVGHASIFRAAALNRLIGTNPVPPRLSLPRSECEWIVPLTVEEVQALADAIPERYRAVIITQAGLGLRVAELLALRVSDIDFLRHKVKIEYQLTQNGLTGYHPRHRDHDARCRCLR